MPRIRKSHVLRYDDGQFFIEAAPFVTANLDEAELYFKYFDLMEAQTRALQATGKSVQITAVRFTITDIEVGQ